MSVDAKFEDGAEQPLRLKVVDGEDLKVVSALLQDAVFPVVEMSWQPGKRRFGLLLNRFRWEDKDRAKRQRRAVERVQSALIVEDVKKVSSNGIDRKDTDLVLSVLSIEFTPGEDGSGQLEFILAGDGAIALEVECLNASLSDVTRPYAAPSRAVPKHEMD